MVLAAVVLVGGIGATVLFAASWLSDQRVEQRAEALAKEQVAAMAGQPQGAPPASVRVTAVKQEMLQQRVSVVGRLREVRRAMVASEIEGRVLEVLVKGGDEVSGPEGDEPGTLIAKVDAVWANLAVEQARADLAAAKARSNQAKRELEHQQSLSSRGASDQQALDAAMATAEAEAANVEAFAAALHRAEETAKRVEIRAPFDATVTVKLTEVGQWVDPGGSVVEIVSRGEIDAVIDVPEQYVSALQRGMEIDVVIGPLGRTVTGTVVGINPDGSNAARTYPVKVRMSDEAGLLKVGMSVVARVPLNGEAEYLTVPRDAVAFSEGGAQVWMSVMMPAPGIAPGSDPGSDQGAEPGAEGDGAKQGEGSGGSGSGGPMPQAMPMDVQVLFGEGERFAIRPLPKMKGATLAAGMEVVIEGKEALWPTRPLIVVPPGQPLDDPGDVPVNAAGGPDAGDEALDAPPTDAEPETAAVDDADADVSTDEVVVDPAAAPE